MAQVAVMAQLEMNEVLDTIFASVRAPLPTLSPPSSPPRVIESDGVAEFSDDEIALVIDTDPQNNTTKPPPPPQTYTTTTPSRPETPHPPTPEPLPEPQPAPPKSASKGRKARNGRQRKEARLAVSGQLAAHYIRRIARFIDGNGNWVGPIEGRQGGDHHRQRLLEIRRFCRERARDLDTLATQAPSGSHSARDIQKKSS